MSNPITVTLSFTYTPTMQHYPDGFTPIQAAHLDCFDNDDIALLLQGETLTVTAVDTVTGERVSGKLTN